MIFFKFFIIIWFEYLNVDAKNRWYRHYYKGNDNDNSNYCSDDYKTPNVRTVLFKKSQLFSICWDKENIALLLARAIMQDILPRKIPHDIPLLLDYFKECFEIINVEVNNYHVRLLMITAMADTIGGYLQGFGLPIMKKIYYEGNLEFEIVYEFYELQHNLKTILSTNGDGWLRPVTIKSNITNIIPLSIPNYNDLSNCQDIITIKDCTETSQFNNGMLNDLLIPLPKLDDEKCFHSILVPIRGQTFYNLQSNNAYNILITYYVKSVQCYHNISRAIKNQISKNERLNYFEFVFYNWMMKTIIPRLDDEIWYPGFSSVYRILETMNERGIPVDIDKTFQVLKDVQHTNIKSDHNTNENLSGLYDEFLIRTLFTVCLLLCTLCLAALIKKKGRKITCNEEKFEVFQPTKCYNTLLTVSRPTTYTGLSTYSETAKTSPSLTSSSSSLLTTTN